MQALEQHADRWLSELDRRLARAGVAQQLFGGRPAAPRLGGYEITRRLGHGVSSVVFEARHLESGQRVALKVLREWTARAIAELKREFRTLGEIHHENLVQLHELNLDDDAPFITMELVEGDSLAEATRWVLRSGGLRLLRAASQLVDAISSLHAAGILHGDLKPSNLRVAQGGRLVVLDFGLTPSDGERGATHAAAVRYMAPERVRGVRDCPASDWFSVGMLLSELLPSVLPRGSGADARLSALGLLCKRLLAEDPDARPSAAELRRFFSLTAEPHEPLRPRHVARPHEHAVFGGRAHELRRLRAAFAQAAAGRCVVVHVCGAPGIGKSALVDRFLLECSAGPDAATVLAGSCHERELIRFNAFEGVVDALASALRAAPWPARKLGKEARAELCRLFPALADVLEVLPGSPRSAARAADPDLARMLAFEALRKLLQSLAERRPVVLCFDDLQWGDADSARAIGRLISDPTLRNVLVIASYRADDASHSAAVASLCEARVRGRHIEHRIELGPLSAADSLRVASALSRGALPDAALVALCDQAAGSPLFLGMLIRHGSALGEQHATSALGLPDLLRHAVGQLPPECQALLQLCALAARPIGTGLLLRAASVHGSEGARVGHVARLQRSGWLRSVPLQAAHAEGLLCFHDRLRETLVATLTPEARRRGHVALADAAAALAADDHELLAIHNQEAGRLDLGAAHAERAGDRAAAGLAIEHAVSLYGRALDCRAGARPPALVEKLAKTLADSGRCAAAAELYLEVARQSIGARQRALRMRAAAMLMRAGLNDQTVALLSPLLRPLGLRVPRSRYAAFSATLLNMLRIRLRGLDTGAPRRVASELEHQRIEACFEFADGLGITDPLRATPLMLRGFALALDHGSDEQVAHGLAGYASMYACAGWGSARQQDAWLLRAERLARRGGDPIVRGWMQYYAAFVRSSRGDFRGWFEALEASRSLASINPPPDMNWRDIEYEIGCCTALALLGDVRALEPPLERALRLAHERENGWQIAALSGSRAVLLLARDEPDAADDVLDTVLDGWPSGGSCQIVVMAILTKCAVALYRNQPQPALELLQRTERIDVRLAFQRFHPFKAMRALIEGQLALACFEKNARHNLRTVEAALGTLGKLRTAYAAHAAETLRASLAQVQGRKAEADAHFERCAQLAGALGIIDAVAAARMRQAQLRHDVTPREVIDYCEHHRIANPEHWARIVFPVDPEPPPRRSGVYRIV